jgi:hypothetical protein
MFHIEFTFFVRFPSNLSLRSLPHSAAKRHDLGASGGKIPAGFRKGKEAEYCVGLHVDVWEEDEEAEEDALEVEESVRSACMSEL